jgi:signal peptidase I
MIQFCIRWLISKNVRQAVDLHRTVRKITRAQSDLLKSDDVLEIQEACNQLRAVIHETRGREKLQSAMKEVERVANKRLQPYPHASMRENVEVVLVAVAVAMGIRTFFLQPFKIPTGSMQPTLFGITHEDFRNQPDVVFPTGVEKWFDRIFRGVKYVHIVAKEGGYLEDFEPLTKVMKVRNRQRFKVGGVWYSVSGLHDELIGGKYNRAGLHFDPYTGRGNQLFEKGDDIVKLKLISGDHLFVDRMTYNFRTPFRGEIVVFATKGIPQIAQNQFYIKRLVALGDEEVRVADDRHMWIDGDRMDAATYRFENVYGFDPKDEARDSHWSGHVNNGTSRRPGMNLAPLFPGETQFVPGTSQVQVVPNSFKVRPNHLLVFGDNTLNSLDSRAWGDFTRTNVIGKSAFVYWPILGQGDRISRFGWSHR